MNDSPVITKSSIHPTQVPPSHIMANTPLLTMKKVTVAPCQQVMNPSDNPTMLLNSVLDEGILQNFTEHWLLRRPNQSCHCQPAR